MEAAKSGKSVASLMADFNASHKAEEQRFQVCLLCPSPCSHRPGLGSYTSEHKPLSLYYQLLLSKIISACYSVILSVYASSEAQHHLRASVKGPCDMRGV